MAIVIIATSSVCFGQNSGGISGVVTFQANETPLHQASVRIVELKRSTVTDDDGKFNFENLPAGIYTVIVHQEGFADQTRKVTVKPGESATADFALNVSGIKEQVTVTASGSQTTAFESIASVNSSDSLQIAQRAAVGLGDVLDDQSGVAKRSFGPGNSRPVIRGFDGDRVLVATDGVRVGSLASQSGDHSEPVDPLAADRIEVVKGPATLLYGSNAIGGVVNAISGHDEGSHPGFRGYFTAVGNSNSAQASTGGGAEYGFKNWMFWGNVTGQRSSDYSAGGDFGKVRNTFTRTASGNLGFGYYGKEAFINANVGYYQNRFGIPIDESESDPEVRSLRMWKNDQRISGGFTDLQSFISSFKFTFNNSNYRHQEIHDNEVGTTFRNRVQSYRGMFEQKPFGVLNGRFGFEGFHREYQTTGEEVLINGPVKQNSFALFGLEELKFERVTLQFGGRVENNRYRPSDDSLRERDFTGFSGGLGARFALWKGGAFVANYSHSYRAPALEELYNYGPHDGTLSFEVGDNDLHAESSNGLDLSFRQQNGRLKFETNFYYYRISNFVFLAPNGETDSGSGLPIADYRQGDSTFYGTEVTGDLTVNKYFNILGGLDYVNASLTDGRSLPRIPPFRGRLGVDIHYRDFSIKPEGVFAGRQDRVFDLETPTAGYGLFNVAANYVIPSKHASHIFFVNAYNLGDKLYYNHISFIKDISPEIGRGVKFGYTVRFF